MTIQEVVDCDRYPYVNKGRWRIKTYLGYLDLIRGFLADGASGVIDLCKEAFFSHDILYIHPFIEGRRVTKFQCDMVYGQILCRNWRLVNGIIRPAGLQLFGHKAWNGYRERETKDPDFWRSHVVPRPDLWLFPSYWTKDAIWRGPDDASVGSAGELVMA